MRAEWMRGVQPPRWRRSAEVLALCALAVLALAPAWCEWRRLAAEPASLPTNYRHEAPAGVTLTEREAR